MCGLPVLQVIAFASHPGALAMAAAAEQRTLHAMGSMGRPPPQQDLVAALNARIAKENAELAELRAKVVKERERCVAVVHKDKQEILPLVFAAVAAEPTGRRHACAHKHTYCQCKCCKLAHCHCTCMATTVILYCISMQPSRLPRQELAHSNCACWAKKAQNILCCRYAANQTASLGAAQAVVDVRHRLTLQPQDGCFVLYVEAAVSLFALALQVGGRHVTAEPCA